MSWSVIIERYDSMGNALRDVRANFANYDDAVRSYKSMMKEFMGDPHKIVNLVHDEQAPLNFEIDPAFEAMAAQHKHELEEQRIQGLCDSLEGVGMCTNLTPVGDEYDRNTGQCHVCDEWGIVHCDFGIHGSRALCEKHLNMAAQDRLQTHLNLYGSSRVYGGPEEGGWWYSVGEPLLSIPVCDNLTDEAIEQMRSDIRELGVQLIHRLNCGWEDRYETYGVIVELRPGRYWPLERPHYE